MSTQNHAIWCPAMDDVPGDCRCHVAEDDRRRQPRPRFIRLTSANTGREAHISIAAIMAFEAVPAESGTDMYLTDALKNGEWRVSETPDAILAALGADVVEVRDA